MAIIASETTVPLRTVDDNSSYVDWPAIFGGVAISSASLVLLSAVGLALGLASVSPWTSNPSPTAIGLSGAAWFALCALYAGGVSGYLVGRLRRPVLDSTADERSNRDGLNGLVAWGLGLLVSAMFAGSVATSAIGTVASTAATAVAPVASEAVKATASTAGNFVSYYADRALRQTTPPVAGQPATDSEGLKSEIATLITRSLTTGTLSPDDRAYLDKVVAQRAGISEADAKTRVDQILADAKDAYAKSVASAKEAADTARKVTASATSWFAIISFFAAMLAWYAAIIGGRSRDQKLFV